MSKPPVLKSRNIADQDLSHIKAFVSDVDGVLTDGRLIMLNSGQWRRHFFIQDGLGLKRMVELGIKVALITGSNSEDIAERATTLGIESVFQGVDHKLVVIEKFLSQMNIPLSDTIYMGDDLPDTPILDVVGIPVTVPNAHPSLLHNSKYFLTSHAGGAGAVREVCDILLKAKGA